MPRKLNVTNVTDILENVNHVIICFTCYHMFHMYHHKITTKQPRERLFTNWNGDNAKVLPFLLQLCFE